MNIPKVGEIQDGYQYAGGDPSSKDSWSWVGNETAATTGASPAPMKLTEDQGKVQTSARLMRETERNYGKAVADGYDPGTFRNATASILEGLPFGGLDGLGSIVRDDVGDRAHQAAMLWSDAQLKAMSGAAAPEKEVKAGVRNYFPQVGETVGIMGPQKRQSREVAFEAAKIRAGPAGPRLPIYPQNLPAPVYETRKRLMDAGRIDPAQRIGTQANPYVARSQAVADRLPKGSYVITPEGHFGVVE